MISSRDAECSCKGRAVGQTAVRSGHRARVGFIRYRVCGVVPVRHFPNVVSELASLFPFHEVTILTNARRILFRVPRTALSAQDSRANPALPEFGGIETKFEFGATLKALKLITI